MPLKSCALLFFLFSFSLSEVRAGLPQAPAATVQAGAYPDTSDGLQKLLLEILRAATEKDSVKEMELVHGLLMPKNSTWFTVEYGPGFGGSLAAAYERVSPGLEQEIKTIYEGNVERGWLTPAIQQFANPDTADAPIDHFLNCMDKIVPLYRTAFHNGETGFYMSLKPGENGKQAAGDLNGFFVYDQGGFRFIPMGVLMKLPRERPVRIALDTNVMNSKLLTDSHLRYPDEAIRRHVSGNVVVHFIIDTGGNTKELKLVKGDPILARAVMEDMKTWRFEPTTLDGDPVEVDLEWTTGFTQN